jgi:flagellar motor switch/type III secretory pathway protein FliN
MTPAQRVYLASPEAIAAVADRWAHRLGVPVRLSATAGADVRSRGRLPRGLGWFESPSGVLGFSVPADVVSALVPGLLGGRARTLGPVALSESALGVFGYLALETAAALPALQAALLGFERADVSPFAHSGSNPLTWRLEIDGRAAIAEWGTPRPVVSAAAVPITLRLLGAWPGAWPAKSGGRHPVGALRFAAHTGAGPLLHLAVVPAPRADGQLRFTVLAPTEEPRVYTPPESLPCTLSLDLGSVVLPAGVVAGLAPGDLLPVDVPAPAIVWLRAGDVLVAEARLVATAAGFAVEITRALLPGP